MRINQFAPALAGIVALAGFSAALVAAGCGSSNGTASTSTTPSLETLRSAPVSATVGSVSLSMTAQVYRNAQPGINSGPTLAGTVTITPAGGQKIPAGFTVTAAYAVQGSTSAAFTITTPIIPTTSNVSSVQATLANGPALAAGTTASIVVSFTDNLGNSYLLQTPTVAIGTVY